MSLEGAIAAHRFGLGARPGEIAQRQRSPKAWLMDQIERSGGRNSRSPTASRFRTPASLSWKKAISSPEVPEQGQQDRVKGSAARTRHGPRHHSRRPKRRF